MALVLIAQDDYNRADANPISGNWLPFATYTNPVQLQSKSALATALNKDSAAIWNSPAMTDQAVEQTILTMTDPDQSAFITTYLRVTGRGTAIPNGYRFDIEGNTGGDIGSAYIQRVDSGVITSLSESSVDWNIGDIFRAEVIGSVCTIYQNGISCLTATDDTYGLGMAGIDFYNSSILTNSSSNLFSLFANAAAEGTGWVNSERNFVNKRNYPSCCC